MHFSCCVLRHSMATTVSALLVQSISRNEKSSMKFNIEFFGKLEIEFSLEIKFSTSKFQYSIYRYCGWAK